MPSPVFRRDDLVFFFFFNDTATTEIYTLSLHDALPISAMFPSEFVDACNTAISWIGIRLGNAQLNANPGDRDRKSTRLNSSHQIISYAVFCLKKKKPNMVKPMVENSPKEFRGLTLERRS